MNKNILTPGKKLISVLEENGFREVKRGDIEMIIYYTNENLGNQIKLNYRTRTIIFLSSEGNVLKEVKSTTSDDIVKFNKESV